MIKEICFDLTISFLCMLPYASLMRNYSCLLTFVFQIIDHCLCEYNRMFESVEEGTNDDEPEDLN